ncbi:hypothetical protein C8R45DRAFT_483859 [Mycena sanguinolenta]|nr:hypothetical protein C8R45DRAFT_483859 [Mycena sanguinolenta]
MAIYNSDEEFSIPSPTGDSEFGDILLPPSTLSVDAVDGANQRTMAIYNFHRHISSMTDSKLTDNELDYIVGLLSPYQELEKKLADINSKAFQSNQHSGSSRWRIHYAGVDYSKQMLAMMAFNETEGHYYLDLEKLIEYHDPRNHVKYEEFSQGIDNLFEKAEDIRNLSEVLLRGLQEATSEYQAYATYLGDMLLATIPKLLQLYQAYIETLPAALTELDLENPQRLWQDTLSRILNLLPLPLLRLRHYPDSLASLIRLVQSSNNDLDKSDLVTLICALSLMKELVNTINSSAVNVERHLTILLSEEFASKAEFSHPQPLRAAMVYTGRDYPEIMLLRLTFLHSEWMYSKDLDGLMTSLDALMSMRQNKSIAKDIQMVSANIMKLQTLSQKLHHTSDQSFIESIIDMFSKLARPYRQYGQHYSQVSACIQSPLPEYEAYLHSLLALPMQRLHDYQDLIGSIVQVTESFNPDRQALLSAKSMLQHTLEMIKTFSVEDEDHSDPTGMVQPDSPPDIGHAVKLTQQYMIANGGFGSVYQGMYSDGYTRQVGGPERKLTSFF